jgi:hypothetical protein
LIYKRWPARHLPAFTEKDLHIYLAAFDFRYNAHITIGVIGAAPAERAFKSVAQPRN